MVHLVDLLIVSFRSRGWNVSCGRVSSVFLFVVRYRVSLIWVPLLPELLLRVGLRCNEMISQHMSKFDIFGRLRSIKTSPLQ